MHLVLVTASAPEALANVRAAVRDFLSRTPVDPARHDLIVLAIDEACANIIRHAYSGLHTGRIRITLRCGPRRFATELRDYGAPLIPGALKGRSLDNAAPGGLGLHLIRTAFPEVRYLPRPRGTLLVLRLPLDRKR